MDSTDGWLLRRDGVASIFQFHRPDIIGLQEVFEHQLTDLNERLPNYAFFGVGRQDGETAGEFCPIGYRSDRFTIADTDTFWLSTTPTDPGSIGWDADFPRIVTRTTLQDLTTDISYHVYNTHFDHEGELARENSAHLLRDRLKTDAPVIVIGDFNCERGSNPYQKLAADNDNDPALYNSKFQSECSHHGPHTTRCDFENLKPNRTIDYIFVTEEIIVSQHGSLTDLDARGRFPSDHLPVIMDGEIPANEV